MLKTKVMNCPYCKNGKIAKYHPYGTPDFYETGSWGERDPMKWFECEKCKGKAELTYKRKTKTVWEPI